MSNYETSDEQTLVRPKRFLFVGFLILIVSILLYWGVSMYSANSVWQTQQDIFLQESVTATTEVESAKKILQSANETKQREAVVPVGITSGVRFYTDGIMVLGIGDVVMACGHRASPSQGKLEVGDIVQKVNGKVVEDISQMVNAINDANGAVLLGIIRDDTSKTIEVTPVKSGDDAMVKIGCWVRDSTQGIGTITYYNPLTKCFGALGHGIMDVDTGRLLSVSSGHLFKANIVDIRKGEKGMPGELIGEIDQNSIIADITKNTTLGLYGQINIDHID
ncbi:MAG: hypothetical protein FWE44_07040, partial [Defluviitaleaceae bacterium]|nr:hypothetical protein [Defluviitaleaceae bacterium]